MFLQNQCYWHETLSLGWREKSCGTCFMRRSIYLVHSQFKATWIALEGISYCAIRQIEEPDKSEDRRWKTYSRIGNEDWPIVSASISNEALLSSTRVWCLAMYLRILAVELMLLSSALTITALHCFQSFRLWVSFMGWPKLHAQSMPQTPC